MIECSPSLTGEGHIAILQYGVFHEQQQRPQEWNPAFSDHHIRFFKDTGYKFSQQSNNMHALVRTAHEHGYPQILYETVPEDL